VSRSGRNRGQQRRALLPAGLLLLALPLAHSNSALAQSTLVPVTAPGFKLSTFAVAPSGSSAPDSIAIVKNTVWVAYGNGGKPDGSDGGKSTIIEYSAQGKPLRTLTVVGHSDGLRLDPRTNKLWAMQNEDSNPNLVIIDPATGSTDLFSFAGPQAHGGGYDDMSFKDGVVYVSASNPTPDAKGNVAGPSIVRITLGADHKVTAMPVLPGMPKAIDITTGATTVLNLTDPDSMIFTPAGDLLLDDQGDAQLVLFRRSTTKEPAVQVLPLLGGVQVDDTVFATARHGYLLIADRDANTVYKLEAPVWDQGAAFSASTGVPASTKPPITPAIPAYVGQLDLYTGAVIPVVSNLASPHGMAFAATE
jgi:hypothetical protein